MMADGPAAPDPVSGTAEPGSHSPAKEISPGLLMAMTTDQFVLQSAASTTVTESVGRATLYISALASSLVALGFATARPSLLGPLLAIVLPTVFLLGVFTIVRLVDTSIANVQYLTQIAAIRRRYAALDDEAPMFFAGGDDLTGQALTSMATRGRALPELFTTASMIGTINAIVGGVGAGLALRVADPAVVWLWVGGGVVMCAVCVVVFAGYQHARSRILAG